MLPQKPSLTAALAFVIRRRRVKKQQSAKDVYGPAGLGKSVYERLEENVRGFSAEQIRAIARVHGMKAWELMQEAEDALDNDEVPPKPPSVAAWRKAFGFDP
ncbi:helix-turn-helix domain-containing protein [Nocardia sp. NPDC050630]|uniref:helix-turn-helix domain-containing protein n=1 Tax=Nocardia sp. NPDC050630 TaxID=3364321 RepID=UPI0037B4F718